MKNNMKKTISLLVIGAFLIFCEWFFFRNLWGTDLLIGDNIDGRLTNFITEHWWSFFHGRESFGELAMLYPVKNAIGYSDMFLGFGIIHSVLRLFSIDMYDAYTYTLITMHCIGTLSMFYLCYKKLALSMLWSLFATIAFQFSSTYSLHLLHTQLMALSILPIITIFIVDFFNKYHQNRNYNIPAYLGIFTFVLLIYNSWYIAYFAAVFALVFILVYLCLILSNHIKLYLLWTPIKKMWSSIARYALFAIILLVPFVYISLPIIRQSGGFSYAEFTKLMPEFVDIINVGENNWMLGKFIAYLGLAERGYTWHNMSGYSIILLMFFILSMFWGFKFINLQSRLKNVTETDKCWLLAIKAIFISIIICQLLVIRLSANGVSLWGILYHILPGASSVRFINRFMLWLSFPMALVTAYVADKYSPFKNGKKKIIVLCVLGLLFASNINKNGIPSWHKNETIGVATKVALPPQDAKIFFIINDDYNLPHNSCEAMDAYEIASTYHLKTINGITGRFPKDWHLGDKNHYNQAVKEWVNHNKLENVYAYDKGNNVWIPYEEYIADIQQYQPGDTISFTQDGNANKYTESGFSHPEPQHTWTEGRNAQLNLFIKDKPTTNLRLKITAWPFLGGNITSQTVKVYANDTLIETWQIKQEGEYAAIIPASVLTSENIALRFDVSNPMSPKNLGMSEDSRLLGIAFKTLTLSQEEVK